MKTNTLSLLEKEQQFEHDLAYQEYLKITHKEPTEDELNDMEKVFCKATIIKDHKKPLNNLDYQPLQGA